jgi:hypothetical protein
LIEKKKKQELNISVDWRIEMSNFLFNFEISTNFKIEANQDRSLNRIEDPRTFQMKEDIFIIIVKRLRSNELDNLLVYFQ